MLPYLISQLSPWPFSWTAHERILGIIPPTHELMLLLLDLLVLSITSFPFHAKGTESLTTAPILENMMASCRYLVFHDPVFQRKNDPCCNSLDIQWTLSWPSGVQRLTYIKYTMRDHAHSPTRSSFHHLDPRLRDEHPASEPARMPINLIQWYQGTRHSRSHPSRH